MPSGCQQAMLDESYERWNLTHKRTIEARYTGNAGLKDDGTLRLSQHRKESLGHRQYTPDIDFILLPRLFQIDIHERHIVPIAGIVYLRPGQSVIQCQCTVCTLPYSSRSPIALL